MNLVDVLHDEIVGKPGTCQQWEVQIVLCNNCVAATQ